MNKYLALVGALAVMTAAAPAHADNRGGSWYMGASGDVTKPRNSTITGTSTGTADYGFSSGGDLAFGYEPEAFNSSTGDVRAEIEGGYHALGLNKVVVGGVPNASPKGDMKIMTIMANAYYDFHTSTPFTPYIGGGVGDAAISFPKGNGFGNTGGSDRKIAYQVIRLSRCRPRTGRSDIAIWVPGRRSSGPRADIFHPTRSAPAARSLASGTIFNEERAAQAFISSPPYFFSLKKWSTL